MAEPQETTDDNLPDITIDHRLRVTTAPEAGNAIPDGTVPEIGDKMPDGTIYAGVLPDTGEALYVTPADASGTLKWEAAMKYATELDANGHKDWKLPTKAELNVLFENRAAIGGFNESDYSPVYWSSVAGRFRCTGYAWLQRFRDGNQPNWYRKDTGASVRPVRSELQRPCLTRG